VKLVAAGNLRSSLNREQFGKRPRPRFFGRWLRGALVCCCFDGARVRGSGKGARGRGLAAKLSFIFPFFVFELSLYINKTVKFPPYYDSHLMNTVLPITMICQLSTCIIDEVF
jgi:hypothetical protein